MDKGVDRDTAISVIMVDDFLDHLKKIGSKAMKFGVKLARDNKK